MICAATSLLLVILTTLLASGQTLRPPSRPSCSRRLPKSMAWGAWSLFAAATAAKNALPRIPASSACRVLGFLTSAKKVTPWRYFPRFGGEKGISLWAGACREEAGPLRKCVSSRSGLAGFRQTKSAKPLEEARPPCKGKVCELRKGGEGVSLRHYESVLVWCPNCATWRTKVFKGTGLCLVCRLRSRVDRCRRRCEEALLELPDEARAEFLSKQFKRGSSIPPKPKMEKRQTAPRNTRGAGARRRTLSPSRNGRSRISGEWPNAEKARLYRIREKAKGAEERGCGDRANGYA